MTSRLIILSSFLVAAGLTSCKKYLATKSDQSFSTPSTLTDLRALLDDSYLSKRSVLFPQTGSDEYNIPYTYWQRIPRVKKDGYIWDGALNNLDDWNSQYTNILTTNVVLDNLSSISAKGQEKEYDEIKGASLFLRAQYFYQLAQIYAQQYDSVTGKTDRGIVLRLDADFNKPSKRSTVVQTYERIIQDLEEATGLLPTVTTYKSRPNKPAAWALLARVYLQTGHYTKAFEASTNCLQLYNSLIDYNDPSEVDTLLDEPFKKLHLSNKEVIFYLNDENSVPVSSRANVDSTLYLLYKYNDIRKAAFYTPNGATTYRFRGSYNGSNSLGLFIGISTPEIYLIRAECAARLGNLVPALESLNALLVKRYVAGTYTPHTTTNPSSLIDLILLERRKELAFRGLRWSDLKRLNKEPSRAVTLQRNLNNQVYLLPPKDLRYTLLIPVEIMQQTNLEQNPR